MQQRRGTAAQWTAANPVLAAGEIGFETDTNKFKMGNGSSAWTALQYFANAAELAAIIDGAPDLLNTLNELAAAIGDDPAFLTTVATNLSNHEADTTNVHGIANTANLATSQDISNHNSDTTNVHGISDTSELATHTSVQNDISVHNDLTTDVHGISDTSVLATQTDISSLNNSKANLDSPSFIGTVTLPGTTSIGDVSSTEIGYVNGVTSAIQTQLDSKAPIASPTFTGTVSGITKTMVGLGNVDNTSDANKPVSNATQTELDAKANLASPTFTGTVTLPTGTVTSAMILNGTIVNSDISSSAEIATSKISGLDTTLSEKAPLNSPALTGIPTAPTAAAGTNTTQIATTAFVGTAVADLVASAPSTLNTLNELATALGNDASFSTTVTNNLAAKAPLASPTFTGTVTLPTGTVTSEMIADGTIVNADINASAAIAQSKIANLTTDLAEKAPVASPTFTGTITTPIASGYVKTNANGELISVSSIPQSGVTDLSTALASKAPADAPTFTGTVVLPSTTSIGTVSATEIGYIDGVTSAIQTQIDNKAPIASPTFTGTVTVSASGVAFTDGTQTKEGVPSRTTIQQKTASYTLSALTERDNFIEVNSASATTISIPTDASVNFPVGTSIDILQTGAGQVTIAAVTPATTTVNGTPGLKLRTQWSSATLFKRAANLWVVMGDLSA